MSYSGNKFAFNKGSYKSQCAYMLMLIRQKNLKAWMKFKEEFTEVSDDDTYDFYERLVAFYRGDTSVIEKEEKKPSSAVTKKIAETKARAAKKKVTKKKVSTKKSSKKED